MTQKEKISLLESICSELKFHGIRGMVQQELFGEQSLSIITECAKIPSVLLFTTTITSSRLTISEAFSSIYRGRILVIEDQNICAVEAAQYILRVHKNK